MANLSWVVGFSLIGSVGAVGGAGLILLFPSSVRRFLIPTLVSYATGTLLGAAFLGMIPAALERAAGLPVTATILAGILAFFLLEKFVLWRHCHERDCGSRHGRAAPLILIGDAFHNFVDGIVIAAAFRTSMSLGIATSVAVIVHEVPQEIGDFAILLDGGMSRSRALLLNAASALTTLPGALIAWAWLGTAWTAVPFILAFSSASFIYIAAADLIPQLHSDTNPRSSAVQFLLLLAGVTTVAFLRLGH